jgi:alanyl-tRNA synthetase
LLEYGTLEDVREIAQSFTALPKAVFVAALNNPASVLLATSADSGVDAGKTLQAALSGAGGRGGGSARMAQGSVASAALLGQVMAKL